MSDSGFIGTAWNNGGWKISGAGYGIKITARDRDHWFRREWKSVRLILPGDSVPIEVNTDKASFWNNRCRELISSRLGAWMIAQKLAPWPSGEPPRFRLLRTGEKVFSVHMLS